jgi:hypothetical protein
VLQVTPPGFHLLLLPYQEDVRWQEITPGVLGDIAHPPRATAAQVAAAEALVAALTLDEEQQEALRTLRNPAIARQQEVIEVRKGFAKHIHCTQQPSNQQPQPWPGVLAPVYKHVCMCLARHCQRVLLR